MTDIGKSGPIDMDQALLDPGSVFASPEALLLQDGLSTEEKIEILRRWEYDASANCVAVEEGMPGGESDLLRRILLALGQLAGDIDVEHVGPTRTEISGLFGRNVNAERIERALDSLRRSNLAEPLPRVGSRSSERWVRIQRN